MTQKVEWVRAAAGDRWPDVELSMIVSIAIADDHRAAAERVAAERGWGREAADQVLDMPSQFVGSVCRIVEEMQVRRDQYGFSYYVVSDRDMEAFSPVVDRLIGH